MLPEKQTANRRRCNNMIHAICDFCGKDCDRTATLLSMTPFQNFARYHTDHEPYGSKGEARSFVICYECCKKHHLPNPYEASQNRRDIMNDVSIIIQIQIFWMIRNMTKGLSINNVLPNRSGPRVCFFCLHCFTMFFFHNCTAITSTLWRKAW